MDPLSISTSCLSLVGVIAKLSIEVTGFVRDVRDARSDLDSVSRELLSLKTVLELLAEDTADTKQDKFSPVLQKQITGIVANCNGVLVDIEQSLKKYRSGGLAKSAQWSLAGKDDIAKLRSNLEAHKSALDIALDMVALSIAREIRTDTQEIRNDTAAIKQDTAQILAEIARLQSQLPQETVQHDQKGYMLQRYLDSMTTYAETVCDAPVADLESESFDFSAPTLAASSSANTLDSPSKRVDGGEETPLTRHFPSPPESSNFQQPSNANGSGLPVGESQLGNIDDSAHLLEPGGGFQHPCFQFEDPIPGRPQPESDLALRLQSPFFRAETDDVPGSSELEKSAWLPLYRVEVNHDAIAEAGKRRKALSTPEQKALDSELCNIQGLRGTLFGMVSATSPDHTRNLLAQGANISGVAVTRAARQNHGCLKVLMEYGADVHMGYESGGRSFGWERYNTHPISAAASGGNLEAVKLLLANGVDVNAGGDGSVLQAAAYSSTLGREHSLEILSLLLDFGADVNAMGGYFGTALQAAVCSRGLSPFDCANLLISKGADVNSPGGRYGSALLAAVVKLKPDLVSLLLKQGAFTEPQRQCHFDGYRLLRRRKVPRFEFVNAMELIEKMGYFSDDKPAYRSIKVMISKAFRPYIAGL